MNPRPAPPSLRSLVLAAMPTSGPIGQTALLVAVNRARGSNTGSVLSALARLVKAGKVEQLPAAGRRTEKRYRLPDTTAADAVPADDQAHPADLASRITR